MTECEQLLMGGIRSVGMGGPDGNMMPTVEGEQQLQDIWDTSCAPSQGPWGGDFNLFRQAVIDAANGVSLATDVAAVFQASVTSNDSNTGASSPNRPFLPAMLICINVWWFKIYIWRTI